MTSKMLIVYWSYIIFKAIPLPTSDVGSRKYSMFSIEPNGTSNYECRGFLLNRDITKFRTAFHLSNAIAK